MAKRGRTSPRQRAAREAARRAAAAVRLAAAGPPRPRRHGQQLEQRHGQRHDVVAELPAVPAPARAADDLTGDAPSPVSACAAGCEVCAEAADGFGALRAGSLAQRRRFAGPGRPPYAAEKQTLHRGDCEKVEQSVGRLAGDERTAPPAGELTRFAHDGRLSPEWATHMRLLDAAEATRWVAERTGPRGGARYRLCRTCTPELT